MKKLIIKMLKGYKKYISPSLGTNCRFLPSCSEYAMEAVDVHGVLKGGILSVWRILRCTPFGKVGYDPPPEKGRWKNPKRNIYREKKNRYN